jgi:nucleotide-binding universal stress UspA family protein
MTTILIPVDFSAGSIMTIKYALMFARGREIILHLFHIYPDQLMIPDSSFIDGMDSDAFLSTEMVVEMKRQAEDNMKAFKNEVTEVIEASGVKGVELTSTVTGGDPEWEIKDICKRITPELIVMGTRGEGKKAFLEGSMADKIMSTAEIPVIAVPDAIHEAKLKNIMYATNFSDKDHEYLKMLAKVFDDPKMCFHVVHFELKGIPARDIRMMEALQHAAERDIPDREIKFHLMDSDKKSESLKTFVDDKQIDLIAFIAHKTNLFQNLFSNQIHKKDFFKLELPMLALHE